MKRWRSLLLLCAAICMIVPGCASGEQMDATLPSIQGGPTLFDFYDDPEIAAFAEHFYEDPPQSLTFAFHWFAASEYTVTDAETIAATFEALGQIVVGAQTNIVATDSDTYVVFRYDDGRAFTFWFNMGNLCVATDEHPYTQSYEIWGGDELNKILRDYSKN